MTKTNNKIRGVITALVTPFKRGEVDKVSFRRLLKHQLDHGVQGFVINGTTGESPTLESQEVNELFLIAEAEVAGQVPLIIGASSNSTAHARELTGEVASWRPDAILSVVPYYNRPPQRGLKAHFTEVAKAAKNVPVILYNVPSRTVANLETATAAELSRVDNILGIKDATGDMDVLASLQKSARDGFVLLSGDDATCFEFCARGGHGVISVASHLVAREIRETIDAESTAFGGGGSTQKKKSYQELMKHLYIEANPIPVKMALHWMGVIDFPDLRLPLSPLDEKFHKDFKACLKQLGKL